MTHRGAVRKENQDALFAAKTVVMGDMDSHKLIDFEEYPACLAVIDGMGGYEGGTLASRLTAETFAEAVQGRFFGQKFDLNADKTSLSALLEKASEKMASKIRGNPAVSEMGATVAGLLVRENTATAFNCGDCRVYRISQGEIERLTKDHSLVQSIFENGTITEDEMRTHPKKNIVTSAVTADKSKESDLFVRAVSKVDEDEYFICSDGVWEAIPIENLRDLLRGPYPQSAEIIRNALLNAGCRDNISFIWSKSLPS
jgi:protein phosphatase